jgi:hypothetical protein
VRRREFISLLGGAAATWPLTARAQQAERAGRVAILLNAPADNPKYQTWVGAFLQTLALLGWTPEPLYLPMEAPNIPRMWEPLSLCRCCHQQHSDTG